MPANPLEDDPAREERIRERAYHLWQADGEPHGRHDEYWERARELVGIEDSGSAGQLPNPSSDPHQDPHRSQPVEEAALQENLGEFPDRFADQGEVLTAPKSRRAARTKRDDAPVTGAAGAADDKSPATKSSPAAAKPKAGAKKAKS